MSCAWTTGAKVNPKKPHTYDVEEEGTFLHVTQVRGLQCLSCDFVGACRIACLFGAVRLTARCLAGGPGPVLQGQGTSRAVVQGGGRRE
eukprot:scaffold2003_cov420-Prasinococcus_capsulatus_cf.AAC.7